MSLDSPTQSQLTYWREAKELRRRLYAPPNAKPDKPIELNHPHGIKGPEFERLKREARARAKTEAQVRSLIDREMTRRNSKEMLRIAGTKEPIQDWLFVNPERADKTPPGFYARIKRRVAREFGISVSDINGESRIIRFVIPRQVTMYLGYKLTKLSLPQISLRTGGRDHTTTLWAVNRVPYRMSKNWWICLTVNELYEELKAEITEWRRHQPTICR